MDTVGYPNHMLAGAGTSTFRANDFSSAFKTNTMYLFQHSQHVSNGREGYALSKCLFLYCLLLCATFQLSNIPLFAHTSDPWFVACVHFVLVFVEKNREVL